MPTTQFVQPTCGSSKLNDEPQFGVRGPSLETAVHDIWGGLRGIGTVRNHGDDVNCQDPGVGRAAIPTANTASSNRGVKPRRYSGDAAHRVVARRQPYGQSKALRLEFDRQECLFQVQGEFGPRGNNGRTHSTAGAGVSGSAQSHDPRARDVDCQPSAPQFRSAKDCDMRCESVACPSPSRSRQPRHRTLRPDRRSESAAAARPTPSLGATVPRPKAHGDCASHYGGRCDGDHG